MSGIARSSAACSGWSLKQIWTYSPSTTRRSRQGYEQCTGVRGAPQGKIEKLRMESLCMVREPQGYIAKVRKMNLRAYRIIRIYLQNNV
jgi:hypothetical protein